MMNRLLFGFFIFSLARCSTFIANDPVVSFDDGNVLRPSIAVESTDSTSIFIEYWKAGTDARQTSMHSVGKKHKVTLLNLEEESDYNFVVKSEGGSQVSSKFHFRTGKVPEDIAVITKELIDSTLFNGYVLIRKYVPGNGADLILNNRGNIVWYHDYDTAIRRQFKWTDHQSVLSCVDTAHIVDTNLFGERLVDIDLFGSEYPYNLHHDLIYDKNGEIITLMTDSIILNRGNSNQQIAYYDGLMRLDTDGIPTWRWNVTDHIDVPEAIKKLKSTKSRISHANSIVIDQDDDYVVSFRDFHQVWKINSTTGAVMWRLGRGGDLAMDTTGYFIGQHSAFVLGDQLVIFDNGQPRVRSQSRVLVFSIDEQAKTATLDTKIDLPEELASYRMGSAFRIEDNKFLVCASRNPMVVAVIDLNGKILWKVIVNGISFRAYYLADPFATGVEKLGPVALAD